MLTPSQQQALDLDRHLCVIANAGSGKTRVLIERYLRILLEGRADIDQIVAITFTEKAAGELRAKISDAVRERVAVASDEMIRHRLALLRSQLSGAVIGTIHSFCAQILREFPVEAGIDASFVILEEIDRKAIMEESLLESFAEILKGEKTDLQDGVVDAVRTLGKSKSCSVIRMLLEQRDMADQLRDSGGVFGRSDREILDHWDVLLRNDLTSVLESPGLQDLVEVIHHRASGKEKNEAGEFLRTFLRASHPEEKTTAIDQFLRRALTRNGGLRVSYFGGTKKEWQSDRVLGRQLSRLHEYHERILFLSGVYFPDYEAQHRELIRHSRSLFAVYRLALARCEERKLASGVLDFDDLQIKTRNLLKKPDIVRRLSSRFRYFLVDEYQDTNSLQYEILLPLVNELHSGNLCIVGDPKQSIYGFRDANVQVFEKTRSDMLAVVGPSSGIVLAESFRPLRNLAAFTNVMFSRLMAPESENPFAVRFDHIVKARSDDGDGHVEFLVHSQGNSEEMLIARRIGQLVTGSHQVYGDDGVLRPVRFGDIAILIRSRINLGDLELALIKEGIPYAVAAGVGYFQSQSILDLYNYLRFLVDRANDLSLFGILRSPFFALSDSEIFEMSNGRGAQSLWDVLRDHVRHDRGSGFARRAVALLEEDLEIGMRISVPELVERILSRASMRAVFAGVARGSQHLANVEKLRSMASRYSARGFTTLYDFTVRLQRLIEEHEQEGQGVVEHHGNAVQILTVHAAKGLEFPVVVLAGLGKEFQQEREPLFDVSVGLGFEIPFGTDDDAVGCAIVKYLKHRATLRSRTEEKRVFYVACTRARDMLILSGPRKTGKAKGWWRWLIDVLDFDPEACDGLNIRTALTTAHGEDLSRLDEELNLKIPLVDERTVSNEDRHSPIVPSVVPVYESTSIEQIQGNPHGLIFSASMFKTFVECPAKYYLRYHLGYDDTHGENHESGGDTQRMGGLIGTKRGQLVHLVLEKIEKEGYEPDSIRRIIEEIFKGNTGRSPSPDNIAPILEEIERVVHSDYWKYLSRGTNSATEQSTIVSFGEHLLSGTIDRVFLPPEGNWTVLDFKTDRVSVGRVNEVAKSYEPQLAFYSYLIHRSREVPIVDATILFTSIPHSPLTKTYDLEFFSSFEKQLRQIFEVIDKQQFAAADTNCSRCLLYPSRCSNYLP